LNKYLIAGLLIAAFASCKKSSGPSTGMIINVHDSVYTLAPVVAQEQISGMLNISASGSIGEVSITIASYHGVGTYDINGYNNTVDFTSGGYVIHASEGYIAVTDANGIIKGSFGINGGGVSSVSGTFTAP
jgi:hypothetical protein